MDRAQASQVLRDHRPNQYTGCCNKCGRPTEDGKCDAPEVADAEHLLSGRPEYRVHGANTAAHITRWAF